MERIMFTVELPSPDEKLNWHDFRKELEEKVFKPLLAIVEAYGLGRFKWETTPGCIYHAQYHPNFESPEYDGSFWVGRILTISRVDIHEYGRIAGEKTYRRSITLKEFLPELVTFFARQAQHKVETHCFLTEQEAQLTAFAATAPIG